MHAGTLDPLDYGCLTVQDAHYCYCAQETLRGLLARVDRETQPELFELVESKVRGYEDYNRTFLEDWHIRDAQSVLPTEAMRSYVERESFGGAWFLGGFIEEWRDADKPFDEDLALDSYRQSMAFELAVFSGACSDA